jgi:hypothetical protein
MVKNAIVAAIFLLGGFVLSSWWTARGTHATLPDIRRQEEQTAQVSPPPSAADLGAMRMLIRQELQQALAQRPEGSSSCPAVNGASDGRELAGGDPSAPVNPRGHQATPTPAQEAAHAAASTLIDAGIAVGHWTEKDESQWQLLADQLAPGAGQDVRGRLFEAINEGRLIADIRFGRRAGMPQPVAVGRP